MYLKNLFNFENFQLLHFGTGISTVKMSVKFKIFSIYSPMDLSVQGGTNGVEVDEELLHDSDDDATSSTDLAEKAASISGQPFGGISAGLSVVRPEVLFGQVGMGHPADLKMGQMGQGPPIPPFLAPFLAASREAQSGAPSMKEAFQEVLKLFGFPPELAEVFAKNAQGLQALQQQEPNDNTSTDEGTKFFRYCGFFRYFGFLIYYQESETFR